MFFWGPKADFGKILDKIDSMVELLANESSDDVAKQSYCKKDRGCFDFVHVSYIPDTIST